MAESFVFVFFSFAVTAVFDAVPQSAEQAVKQA